MIEEWRDLPGWNGAYQVSDMGGVRSVTRTIPGSAPGQIFRTMKGQAIRPQILKNGYYAVRLSEPRGGRLKTCYVHHLVLETFVGPRPTIKEKSEIRHLNGDKRDCRLNNLVYGTVKENALDRIRHRAEAEHVLS